MSVQDSFDQVVPGALQHQNAFLGIVQKRCNEASLGVTLQPVQPDRKSQRVVMRGVIQAKQAFSLEVYSDPVGPALQVGWQLISPDFNNKVSYTNFGAHMQHANNAALERLLNDPSTVRILNGVVQAFHQMVFLPTLQNLVDACVPPSAANGFLGAQ